MTPKIKLNNYLINGNFEYRQRGTNSFNYDIDANSRWAADRWKWEQGRYPQESGYLTEIYADVPPASKSLWSLSVESQIFRLSYSDTLDILEQNIEGIFLRSFKGKKLVLSFWVKAGQVGTYCVSFRNGSYTRTLIKEYTVNASDTWEKKIIRLQHDATGTWDYGSGVGLRLGFVISAGVEQRNTKDVWISNDSVCTSNQTQTETAIAFSDVCLVEDNEGQTREPEFTLASNNLAEELQLCQRYYEIVTGWGGNVASGTLIEIGGTMTQKRAVPFFSSLGRITVRSNTGVADIGTNNPIVNNFTTSPALNSFWGQIGGFTGLLINTPVQDRAHTIGLRADAEL